MADGGIVPETDQWSLYRRGKLDFFAKQRSILNAIGPAHSGGVRRVILPGGRRSSKSRLAACYACYSMQLAPSRGHLIIAPRIDTTNRVLDEMELILDTLGLPYRLASHPYPTIRLPNGSWIRGQSTDRKDFGLQLRGMGRFVHGIIVDEGGFLKADTWKAIRPILADNDSWLYYIGTTNGRNRFHDLYQWGNDDDRPDYISFVLSTQENAFLPAGEYEKMKHDLTPEEWGPELHGEFTSRAGAVFPDFSREIHLREMPTGRQIVRVEYGIDWGSNNPAVVIPMLLDDQGDIWTPDEWYRSGASLDEHRNAAQRMQRLYGRGRFRCDPSEPQMIRFFRDVGLDAIGAKAEDTQVIPGVDSMRKRLGNYDVDDDYIEPTWHIHPTRCPNLLRELESYHYATGTATRDPSDAPAKKDDHALDAARYVIHHHTRQSGGQFRATNITTSRLDRTSGYA